MADRAALSNRVRLGALLSLWLLLSGCLENQILNPEPYQYLTEVPVEGGETSVGMDLAIIEFDEFGSFWDREQLEDTLELVRRRSAASERGLVVVVHTHGWQNDADMRGEGTPAQNFRDSMAEVAASFAERGAPAPDHVIGVFLGWRGATTRVPLARELTFWDRYAVAARVASYDLRETCFRLTRETKTRLDSKVVISGHSMGGMIIAKTLGPSLSTLVLAEGDRGIPALVDLIILQNPALDALSTYQFIDFLKRSRTRVELRRSDGSVQPAEGPVIVSITSEADWVTSLAYPLGQIIGLATAAFRNDHGPREPSQWHLATRANGHVPELVSHRAWVEDDEIQLARVPGAYNDTPYWIVRVTREISADHGDVQNVRFRQLIGKVIELNQVYETNVQTWLRADHGELPLAVDDPTGRWF
ncbi:MAG: hypothetical protein AAFZ65_07085 [Planctomycetota bacterium]